MSPFRAGVVIGVAVALALVGGTSALAISSKRRQVMSGWELRPALVFTADVPEGSTVTLENLSERPLPEQFLSGSAISPADARLIVGHKVGFAAQAGAVVRWAHFKAQVPFQLLRDCGQAVLPKVAEATAAARKRALEAFQKKMGPGAVAAASATPAPATRVADGEVLVARTDLPEGSVLSAESLARRLTGATFITASNIPAKDVERVAGAMLIVPVQAGDPLLWQMLDSPEHPRSEPSCVSQVTEAIEKERKRVIDEQAAAFIRSREATP